MSNSPNLFSVVVRTLPGHGQLLARAVNSIRLQSYRPIEVIVVEDGGCTSSELIDGMPASDEFGVRYLPMEKIGRCAAGNVGLADAKGEFLGFLDDDDEFLPNHATELLTALDENDRFKVAYAASYISYSDVISLSPLVIEEHRRELFGRQPFELKSLWQFNMFPIQAVIFRRSLFETFGGLCTELDAYEDWDLWLRYACDQDFLYVDAVTSRFRLPSSKQKREMRAEAHSVYLRKLRERQASLLKEASGARADRLAKAASIF